MPQNWLYCDTWCAPEDLSKAKTIDLCNNPQTKEPKLAAARRLIPEWETYDNEIRQLWQKVYGDDSNHAAMGSATQHGSSSTTPEKPVHEDGHGGDL